MSPLPSGIAKAKFSRPLRSVSHLGPRIQYALASTQNQYSHEPETSQRVRGGFGSERNVQIIHSELKTAALWEPMGHSAGRDKLYLVYPKVSEINQSRALRAHGVSFVVGQCGAHKSFDFHLQGVIPHTH